MIQSTKNELEVLRCQEIGAATPHPPPSYPIENIQEGFRLLMFPIFYYEKRGYGGVNFLTFDDLPIFF